MRTVPPTRKASRDEEVEEVAVEVGGFAGELRPGALLASTGRSRPHAPPVAEAPTPTMAQVRRSAYARAYGNQ